MEPQIQLRSLPFGLLSNFSEQVIVNEHKTHPFSFDRRPTNTFADGGYQVVQSLVQHVRQNGSLQVAPQSLDQVQVGAVGEQPVDFDLVPVRLKERKDRPCEFSAGEPRHERGGKASRVADTLLLHPVVGAGDQGSPLVATDHRAERAAGRGGVESQLDGVELLGRRFQQSLRRVSLAGHRAIPARTNVAMALAQAMALAPGVSPPSPRPRGGRPRRPGSARAAPTAQWAVCWFMSMRTWTIRKSIDASRAWTRLLHPPPAPRPVAAVLVGVEVGVEVGQVLDVVAFLRSSAIAAAKQSARLVGAVVRQARHGGDEGVDRGLEVEVAARALLPPRSRRCVATARRVDRGRTVPRDRRAGLCRVPRSRRCTARGGSPRPGRGARGPARKLPSR